MTATDPGLLERQLRASIVEASNAKRVETQLAKRENHSQLVERVAISGDLSKLSPAERVAYYGAVCESLGLNPLTRPFDYLTLNGKMVLYANKGCTDQLRSIHGVSVEIVKRELDINAGVYTVTARATKPDGRIDEDVGAIALGTLKGETLANATMKAHTKAKRRVTLSICGLSVLDESEIESLPSARLVTVDQTTGEVLDEPPRISPHGEVEEGKEYRPIYDEDIAILAIQDSDTLADLQDNAHKYAWEGATEMERWHPESRKRISAAYTRRKRQLEGDLKSQGRI